MLFDVCLQTYGCREIVRQCLESLYATINLPLTAFTVYVYDSAIPERHDDGTRKLLAELQARWPNLDVTYGQDEVGPGRGLDRIRDQILGGDRPLLLNIDSDVWFKSSGWHEPIVALFEKDPKLALCAPIGVTGALSEILEPQKQRPERDFTTWVNHVAKHVFPPRYLSCFCWVRKQFMRELDLGWDGAQAPIPFNAHPGYRFLLESGWQLTFGLGKNGWRGLRLPSEVARCVGHHIAASRHFRRAVHGVGSEPTANPTLPPGPTIMVGLHAEELRPRAVSMKTVPEVGVEIQQLRWEFESFYPIVQKLRPSNVLEIGSWHGGTLWYWLKAMPPGGKILSVDPHNSQHRAKWESWLTDGKQLILVSRYSQDKGVFEMVKALMPTVDFLFIDGDHRYEYAKFDFERYGTLVRPGGIIALHDICPHVASRQVGVWKLWKQIRDQHFVTQEITCSPSQQGMGIGVVYV